eukprot:2334757-Amphidinium_carterae.1
MENFPCIFLSGLILQCLPVFASNVFVWVAKCQYLGTKCEDFFKLVNCYYVIGFVGWNAPSCQGPVANGTMSAPIHGAVQVHSEWTHVSPHVPKLFEDHCRHGKYHSDQNY